MIENEKAKFALTGSSSRKLKRGMANLLAGRAFVYHLFPLTHLELQNVKQTPNPKLDLILSESLSWGSLPRLSSTTSDLEKTKYLNAYTLTYLKEEIQQEQVIRKIDPFREFLEISAQMNGKVLNYSKISKDTGVDPKTIQAYYEILESTWMGFFLPSFHKSIRKAQRVAPKFYWFDIGVKRSLERTLNFTPTQGTSYYGEVFEHYVILEFYRLIHYFERNYKMSYFGTVNSDAEIDLILDRGPQSPLALIEIKSTQRIDEKEVLKLAALRKAFPNSQAFYLSQDNTRAKIAEVQCLPWFEGIRAILGENA
jgi:predicted AAA+ superfamily ATPase